MSTKGSNGPQDGQRNCQVFLAWLQGVTDFKPYIHQGLLSISRIARECGLNRDVFYTNAEIKDIHWPALITRLETEGVLKARIANPVDHIPRSQTRSGATDARIKQIQEENEALKAENRELREDLKQLKQQGQKAARREELLYNSGRLPW